MEAPSPNPHQPIDSSLALRPQAISTELHATLEWLDTQGPASLPILPSTGDVTVNKHSWDDPASQYG